MPDEPILTACRECDLLLQERAKPHSTTRAQAAGFAALCPRCGAHLYRGGNDALQSALALACAALIFLFAASTFPIVGLDIQGQRNDMTIVDAALSLWQLEMRIVAVGVLLTTTVIPLLELTALVWMIVSLRAGRRPPAFPLVFRLLQLAHPWAMVEVFILGILVALVKLSYLAEVSPGPAAWCFGGLMMALTALAALMEPRELWQAWEAAQT